MSKISYQIVPVVMVVYKTQDDWRGFCVPYDVSCNAKTQEEAKSKLEMLVKFYEEGLNKYKNPKNLILKELSDDEDKLFFNKVWPFISKDISKDTESKLKSYKNYVSEELNGNTERKISTKGLGLPLVEYYNRTLAYPS